MTQPQAGDSAYTAGSFAHIIGEDEGSMPLYEYYCSECDGIFEQLRSIREAGEPYPCPECNRESERIMPTSFMAFTVRDGYPRRIPDRGTYWHLGKEVKRPVNAAVPAGEHPDLYRPEPKPVPSKGERSDMVDWGQQQVRAQREQVRERQAAGQRMAARKKAKPKKD